MKKIIVVSVLLVAVMMLSLTSVQASSATLADDLYSKLSAYGVTAADKVKIERYVQDNNITDAQASTVLAKADEAVAVMKSAGVTDVTKLSAADKESIKTISSAAAQTVGLTLTFTESSVKIVDSNGKVIDTITSVDGKLVYTGNEVNVPALVGAAAALVVVVGLVAKKKMA